MLLIYSSSNILYNYLTNIEKFYVKYFTFYEQFLILSFIILAFLALGIALAEKGTIRALILYVLFGIVFTLMILVLICPPFVQLIYPYFKELFTFLSDLYRNLSTYLHRLGLRW